MSPTTSAARTVTLIPGDGIGPEIVESLLRVFAALGAPVAWETMPMGRGAFEAFGDPLPAQTIESFRRTRLAIKGPIETPPGGAFRSPLVRLREEFDLFANLRPARTLLGGGRFPAVDLVTVRENTEGLYAAREAWVAVGDDPHAVAVATAWNTRAGCERLLRFAFDYALRHGRRKVTVVHKANVLKILSGIFLDTARDLYAREFAGRFELETMIVDACAMKLAMHPERFDVIATTNLFGDILSDLAAGVTGGLGLAPGANLGTDAALFEAVHGSAPDIAGRGIANPVALLLAGAMLLDHLGEAGRAGALRRAIEQAVVRDQVRTPDLGGTASGADLTAAIVGALG